MKNTKKVIHVFGSLNIGGAESRMMDVFRKIDKNKVNFHFISLETSENQFFEKEIKTHKGMIDKIPSPREIGIIKHLIELVKIFKENNKDGKLIVHAHTLHHCGIVMLAAKLAKVKIRISHARNTKSQHNGFKAKYTIGLGKVLIAVFATEKLALTKEAANFLYIKTYINNNRFKIVPNAIELDKYDNILEDKLLKLKTQFKIQEDFIIVGHVGRFEKMKNHKFLIELYSEYFKQNPRSILVLIGDGSLRVEIQQLVDELRLTNNVLFLGIRDDVHLWMNIFNVVVMPSLFEGLPGLALESQAAGTPCLLSNEITNKADLGLGLVSYLDLNSNIKSWLIELEKKLDIKKPTFQQIEKKFDERNLSLNKEIKLLYKIYKVNK